MYIYVHPTPTLPTPSPPNDPPQHSCQLFVYSICLSKVQKPSVFTPVSALPIY